jgi:subtilisin family serine protease
VPDALRALSDLPDVAFVQPNYKYKALDTTPNDPKFGNLWGLKNTGQSYQSGEGAVTGVAGVDMGMPKAWDQITDCGSVVVAVVDSGVYYDQEDLTANMWSPAGGKCTLPDGSEVECPNHGYDFVNGDDDPKDEQGHGTHVAGTIGAVGDNNTGITGVCWKTRIMAVRVLSRIGSGTSAAIAQGIDFAVENGADVINLSLGRGGDFDQVMFESMQRANKKQVIAACAAGNSGSDNDTSPVWPASYNLNNIISVAAIDPTGALTSFSNIGATSVDVAAPGQFIESAYPFTETTLEDDFSDYNGLAAAEWGVSQCDLGSEVLPILSNPPDWCAQPDRKYLAGQTMDAYKVFDLSAKGGDIVLWSFLLGLEVADTDEIRAGIDVGGGPPFDQDDIVLRGYGTTLGFFFPFEFDATECKGAPCSAGFQLESAQGSTTGHGAGVILNSFTFKTFNPSTYQLSDGTSMAAPHVAGLAAMLKAAYPKATMKDVILAIFQGGQPAAPASLRGAANGLCTGGYATADGALERLAAIMKEKAVQ